MDRNSLGGKMGYVLIGILTLIILGGGVYALMSPSPSEAPRDDWKRLWDARLAALQSVLGPAEDEILTSPIPFYLGGAVDVMTFRRHAEGSYYVTAGIIGDDRAKPNELGQYELMICLRNPDDWAPKLISNLARYTTEAVLNPGDTMDIAPALPQPTRLDHLLFVPYVELTVDGKKATVLLCLGITKEEYDCIREHGYRMLIDKLKRASVYPFTDLARESVL